MTGQHQAEVRILYATAVRDLLARGATLPEARAAVSEELAAQFELEAAYFIDGFQAAALCLAEAGRQIGVALAAAAKASEPLREQLALAAGGGEGR